MAAFLNGVRSLVAPYLPVNSTHKPGVKFWPVVVGKLGTSNEVPPVAVKAAATLLSSSAAKEKQSFSSADLVLRKPKKQASASSSFMLLNLSPTAVTFQQILLPESGEPTENGALEEIYTGADAHERPSCAVNIGEFEERLKKFKPRTQHIENLVESILKENDYSMLSTLEVVLKEGKTLIPMVIYKDLDRQTIEIDDVVMAKGSGELDQRTRTCYEACYNALGKDINFTTNVLKICTQRILFDAFLELRKWFSNESLSRDIVQPTSFHFKITTNPSLKIVSEAIYPIMNSALAATNSEVGRIKATVEINVAKETLQRETAVAAGATYKLSIEKS